MDGKPIKRKSQQLSTHTPRKKFKRNPSRNPERLEKSGQRKTSTSLTTSVQDLPWKSVRPQDVGGFGADADGGMLMLEEVEGVEVVYSEGKDGNVVGFRMVEPQTENQVMNEDVITECTQNSSSSVPIILDVFDSTLLPAWQPYPLHSALLQSLHRRGFETPTEIQKRAMDVFLGDHGAEYQESNGGGETDDEKDGDVEGQSSGVKQRDVIGIAETGSGKTLAYGLPILHHLLNTISELLASTDTPTMRMTITPPPSGQRRQLQALILAPTRELALQVSEHLNACLDQLFAAQSQNTNDEQKPSQSKPPPPISVAAIVGGMSAQKQRRILSRGVDILVATPGRFWDLCGEDPSLASQLRSLRFLVLDEADRMVEAGHFQELDNILRITSRPPLEMSSADAPVEDPPRPEDLEYANTEVHERNDTLQTFVFSATMSKDLQRDLKRKRSGGRKKDVATTTLDDLLVKLDFRDPDPVIIDLSPVGGRVEGLQESKIECLVNDKDVYLYYFLLRHPGRSLVFLSSIDGIRRVLPLLELLKLDAWPLHSGLQQKQRLKNLDRFRSTPNSVLLATDVAARGLDVPSVDHVIHYQVPRSADAYVHRNGRTARAMHKGFGLVLCAPDERRVFRGVLAGLGREEDDVPELRVEHHLMDKLKMRVQLARKVDGMAHRSKKETHDRNWMRETAEAMEIELPSDLEFDVSEDAPVSKKRVTDGKVAALKAELKEALSQPLIARGVSTRYITSGTRPIVDDILEGENHETLLGLKRMEAGSEVVRKKKKKTKRLPEKQGK